MIMTKTRDTLIINLILISVKQVEMFSETLQNPFKIIVSCHEKYYCFDSRAMTLKFHFH